MVDTADMVVSVCLLGLNGVAVVVDDRLAVVVANRSSSFSALWTVVDVVSLLVAVVSPPVAVPPALVGTCNKPPVIRVVVLCVVTLSDGCETSPPDTPADTKEYSVSPAAQPTNSSAIATKAPIQIPHTLHTLIVTHFLKNCTYRRCFPSSRKGSA